MFSLLRVENLKLYERPSTRVMLAALGGAALFAVMADRYIAPTGGGFWAAVKGQSWVTILVEFFAIIAAGGIVANEYAWGTIKLLLIRPVRRGRILFGKYLALVCFIGLLLAMLLGLLIFFNALVFALGRGGAGATDLRPETFGSVCAYYLLRLVEILVYASLAFMLSALARSNTLAVGAGILAMLLGPELADFLGGSALAKFSLFNQASLTRFAHMAHPGPGLAAALAVVGVYLAAFYGASWAVFTGRDVLQ